MDKTTLQVITNLGVKVITTLVVGFIVVVGGNLFDTSDLVWGAKLETKR